jgi:hypothetical protein
MAYTRFEGMTVRQLKHLVRDWPEEDDDGDPTQVFIETGPGLTSSVTMAVTLNERRSEDGSKKWSDLLLESDAFDPIDPKEPVAKRPVEVPTPDVRQKIVEAIAEYSADPTPATEQEIHVVASVLKKLGVTIS